MMNVSKNFINVNMQFIIGENGEFKDFSEIYGRETTDKDRPSSVLKEAATSEQDKLNKPYFKCRYACMDASDKHTPFQLIIIFQFFFSGMYKKLLYIRINFSARVRTFIICKECGKRRVVYSAERLNHDVIREIEKVQDTLIYVCGSTLFPFGSKYFAIILCKRDRNVETLWRQLIILVNLFVSDKMCSNFGFILKQFRKRYKLNFNYENFIILQEFVQNLQKFVFLCGLGCGWGGGGPAYPVLYRQI